jgi:hypothetical protein
METNETYKQKQEISSRKLGNEVMLYDSKNDKVHVLNETGALVWSLIDGKNNIQSIINHFLKEFPKTNPAEVIKDIAEITDKLAAEGLITPITLN